MFAFKCSPEARRETQRERSKARPTKADTLAKNGMLAGSDFKTVDKIRRWRTAEDHVPGRSDGRNQEHATPADRLEEVRMDVKRMLQIAARGRPTAIRSADGNSRGYSKSAEQKPRRCGSPARASACACSRHAASAQRSPSQRERTPPQAAGPTRIWRSSDA